MPTISNFYGMTIKIYFLGKEHNPPHIHVIYGEYTAAINIKNCKVLDGDLPKKALNLVEEWINIHREELMDIWNKEKFKKINPLI